MDGWMTMPDMGHLIASVYNVALFHLSIQQCLTFLPLRSVPVPTDSRKEIAIGFVNNNHFVEVFLLPGHPVPPIATNWYKFRHPCAKEWEKVYISSIERFIEIIGNDVATNEIMDIDSNSFNDESDEFVHAAATRIQNKFRSWKGRKDFLIIRGKIVKIQAHVRGRQVRNNYKETLESSHQVRNYYKEILQPGRILDKDVLHWSEKVSCCANFCCPSNSCAFSPGLMGFEQRPIGTIGLINHLTNSQILEIQLQQQQVGVGTFDTAEDAALGCDRAANKLREEFSELDFPPTSNTTKILVISSLFIVLLMENCNQFAVS
ncbi:Calmodulin-binding transcription activator [Melia azedarach]|uniref:Calmodulin-binding transcription activator n=1 Tax=Melia azedarach TaxID=155640 RepID=A0ACC1XWC7_MELAZ|nr:Calmodulin-binding transcription activator [Melia azedarach]